MGAWSHSNTGQACTLRGKGRVWLFFSHWVSYTFGKEIRFAVVVKHSKILHVSLVLCTVMLPCNVAANLSSERNITLKDSCSSLFFLLIFFLGLYLFINSGYTADWENRALQACFVISIFFFLQGSNCNAEMSGRDTWVKASSLALPLTATCGWNYSAEKQGKLFLINSMLLQTSQD